MTAPRRKRTYRILPAPAATGTAAAAPPPPPSPASAAAAVGDRPQADREDVALEHYGRPRQTLIAEAAYYRSLRRRGERPDPIADWLAAEREIDALLREAPRDPGGQPGRSRSAARSQA